MGHDSAFKDRNVQLQSVRVAFIPTQKTDIRDLGPMDEVGSLPPGFSGLWTRSRLPFLLTTASSSLRRSSIW